MERFMNTGAEIVRGFFQQLSVFILRFLADFIRTLTADCQFFDIYANTHSDRLQRKYIVIKHL